MRLKDLLCDVDYQLIQGDIDLEIKDITYDSRKADSDTLFVALKGFRVDGHDYIDQAIENGCKCIILEEERDIIDSVTVIKLEDTRTDLSILSRTLFHYQYKEMTTISITGTNGKTTTSSMIKKILEDSGIH